MPYEFLRYLVSYIEELKYLDKLLKNKDIAMEDRDIFYELLKNEDFIYELCVWLATNAGEENYYLFIDSLEEKDRELFIKYIYFKNNCLDSKNKDVIDLPLEEDDIEDYSLEDEELTIEENLMKGELYYLGKEVERDYKKAKKYFEKAADFGSESAEGYLGLFYEKGYGVDKDIDEALYWYKKAASKGDIFSKYSLGYMYYEGKDVERNLSNAFKWYKEAAEDGFGPAQYALSYLYKNGEGCEKNLVRAYYWLEESADNDFEDAYHTVGRYYLYNRTSEENHKKAFRYLSKGSEINDERCLYLLADMYSSGMYVNKDNKKAIELYKRIIAQGDMYPYYLIGLIYEKENDIKSALEIYKKGYDNENIACARRLAELYYEGKLIRKNKKKAIQLFEICAKYKDPYALYFLASEYYKDDPIERKKCLLEAVEMGSFEAAKDLLEDGINNFLNGESIEDGRFLSYINMLSDNVDPYGDYYYGLLYYYGIIVEKDLIIAFSSISKAAQLGCEKAIEFIPKSVIDF